MAAINPDTGYPLRPNGDNEALLYLFSTVTVGDTTAPIPYSQHADICWQAYAPSSWGGSTLTIQGSNDGTNWFTMKKADGSGASALTADGGFTSIERPVYVRASLASGTGTVNVLAFLRKAPQPRFG